MSNHAGGRPRRSRRCPRQQDLLALHVHSLDLSGVVPPILGVRALEPQHEVEPVDGLAG